MASAVLALGQLAAQQIDLTGRVVDLRGKPVAAARVTFEPLDLPASPIPGVRSGYQLAQHIQLARQRLPTAITDREGEWRVTLSTSQAALTTSGLSRYLMQVRAPDHAAWQRAIDGDLTLASEADVVLAPLPAAPPLTFRVLGIERQPAGFCVVERAFRVTRNRTIWIPSVIPIADDGQCEFDQAVRIPGEPAATSPTAREEAYRVTVYPNGCEPLRAMLAPGSGQRLTAAESPWRPRKILAARAEPPRPPFRATYRIENTEQVVDLSEPVVPLFGDLEPVRVETGSGLVELDAWDPDLPLFLIRDGAVADATGALEPEPNPNTRLDVVVLDSDGRHVLGAGIWIENRITKRAPSNATVFAVTDPRGRARLSGLVPGTFSLLAHHPRFGIAEALADLSANGGQLEITLRPGRETKPTDPIVTGVVSLDLRGMVRRPEAKCSVGMFGGARLIWRRFDRCPERVSLEGLPLGPTSFFVRIGDGHACFFGDHIARARGGAALRPETLRPIRFSVVVRDENGDTLDGAQISLGDKPGRDGVIPSTSLFPRAADGSIEVRLHGRIWVTIVHDGFQPAQALLDANANDEPVEVTLTRTPIEPEEQGPPDNRRD